MAKLSIKDLDVSGKKVLMRVDFNVPLDEKINITDDTRIRASLPSIKYLLDKGSAKVILVSHLGRPKGAVSESLRLDPVARRLSELLNEPVKKLNDCIGEEVKRSVNDSDERVILLENLRFYKQEEKNDPQFSRQLAELAQVYVNDAFGTAHRAHASTEGVTHFLTSAAGFLLEKEIAYLGDKLTSPEKPFVVILGGAKVSDKIAVIENLLPKAESFLIGGGMAYTFLKAKGINIGGSILEADKIELAKSLLKKAQELGKKFLLPVDHICSESLDHPESSRLIDGVEIPDNLKAFDIGPKTIQIFKEELKGAKTVVWNGPVGVSEVKEFSAGTKQLLEFLTGINVTTILGGGDTAAAAVKFAVADKITHISTGGGASLEYMEGKTLPGIAALSDKK